MLTVDASATKETELGPTGLFTLLTLGAIPSYQDYNLTLKLEFTDENGTIVKAYRREVHATAWWWLPFILWGPAISDLDSDETMIEDMARDILLEMYKMDYSLFRRYAVEPKHA